MGHDYSHYFARLLIGADHFWKNGLKILHFTPYLCGGVPFHADPQQIFYSLPQFLAFFWEVLPATYFSFLVFYFLGYWGMWQLAHQILFFEKRVCHFLSLLFLLNGFSFNHLFVGHITHMPFLLGPWLLYFFAKRRSVPFSLILIYCIYSGALHVLVVFGVMLALFLPKAIQGALKIRKEKELLWFLLLAPLLVALTCGGKLYAAYRYSPLFFMHHIDSSGKSVFELVVNYLWFNPFDMPDQLPFGKWSFGSWEFTAPVSRLTMVLGMIGAFLLLKNWRENRVQLLGVGCVLILILILSAGTSFNELVPFFNRYHNPLKILGALILPLLLLSGLGLQALLREVRIGDTFFLCLGLFVVAEAFVSSEFILRTPGALGFRYPGKEFAKIRAAGGLPRVSDVISGGVDDYMAMKMGKANLSCYEPLFGYRRENFHSVLSPSDRALNHPGCLLYSNELGCEPWAKIDGGRSFELFSEGRVVDDWIPKSQRLLDGMGLLFGMILIAPLLFSRSIMKKLYESPA